MKNTLTSINVLIRRTRVRWSCLIVVNQLLEQRCTIFWELYQNSLRDVFEDVINLYLTNILHLKKQVASRSMAFVQESCHNNPKLITYLNNVTFNLMLICSPQKYYKNNFQ